MMDVSLRLKEGLGRWLGGLGRAFSGKAREAKREIGEVDRPEPRTPAEEALWQAMGWSEPEEESAVEVAADKAIEALQQT